MDNLSPRRTPGTTLHVIILSVITVACLLPFADKAFHIDDTLFVWAAQNILEKPLDFYGFVVNWYGMEMPMYMVMKNPPLASYFAAVAGSLMGFGEMALHTAFFLPAIGFTTGVYFIARRFTTMPFQAALAACFTPVFIVSATSVMSDILMLAFWCWAIVLWLRGTERASAATLFLASLLIALSALTKYFGICLIPLLCVYSVLKGYSLKRWVPWMVLSILILAGYQWATYEMYGRGLLFDAAVYASVSSLLDGGRPFIGRGLVALFFAGACIITALFYMPLLWSRRALAICAVLTLVIGLPLAWSGALESLVHLKSEAVSWWVLAECVVFAAAGINLLAIALADLLKRRDPAAVFLFLWIIGTFLFAGFVNWTNNGRSILPMAPAVAILLMRRIEDRSPSLTGAGGFKVLVPLIPALVLSFMVAKADYTLANTARTAAAYLNEEYAAKGRLWFQGHWGFQYYMEEAGAEPIDWRKSQIRRGDFVVVPLNNTNLKGMFDSKVLNVEAKWYDGSAWVTVMSGKAGAGFYSDIWGPLPYVIGPAHKEGYLVFRVFDVPIFTR